MTSAARRWASWRRAARKSATRTAAYAGAALRFREPERDQVFVVASFLAGLIWMAATTGGTPGATLPFALLLLVTLLPICAIDARWGIIPDVLVLQLAALGLVVLLTTQASDTWLGHVVAAGLVFALGHLLHAAYRGLRGYDGFGLGDVKLVAAAALWVRWEALPFMMIVAVLSAMISLALVRLQRRLTRRDAVPFGPHLALGLWAMYLCDPTGDLAVIFD